MGPLLGVAAVVLIASTTRKRSTDTSSNKSSTKTLITFKPVDKSNPDEWKSQWCSPSDEWGGNRDSTKVRDTGTMYVKFWGVPPPRDFNDAIAERDPCSADEAFKLVQKWPPFPGETLTQEDFLQRVRNRQIVYEQEQIEAAAEEKTAEAILLGLIEVGAVAVTIAPAGAGTPIATSIGAGLAAGGSIGKITVKLGQELYR